MWRRQDPNLGRLSGQTRESSGLSRAFSRDLQQGVAPPMNDRHYRSLFIYPKAGGQFMRDFLLFPTAFLLNCQVT